MLVCSGSTVPRSVARIGLVFALALCFFGTGCSRKYYRNSADKEVQGVLTEKNCYEDWKIEQFHVYPDARARFADPSNPDRPPMPNDDPAAKCLSPNPQRPGKAGQGSFEGTAYMELLADWDAQNRAQRPAEIETAIATIPGLVTPPKSGEPPYDRGLQSSEHAYLITLDQACELALINSREFQDRREDLYLAALPVTLERFAFAAQFLAADEVIREYTGRQTPEGLGNRWRSNSTLGLNKLFPTGALLIFRLANQVVVNMADSGGPRVRTPATLSLDLTQPLLRDGGLAVTLEPLTQVERSLLYAIRAYSRFREEFFVYIAAGGNFGTNFNTISPLGPSAQAPNEGYFSTILRGALLENARRNVLYLESIRALYRALLQGGDVSQLQVDQVELDLLTGRSGVLLQTQLLRDALDRFKQQLGVPTSVPLELDNAPLKPLVVQQQRFLDVVAQFHAARTTINTSDWENEPERVRERFRQLAADSPLVRGTKFVTEFPNRWRWVESMTDLQLKDHFDKLKAERSELLNKQAELWPTGVAFSPQQIQRLAELERARDLAEFETSVRKYLAKPWQQPGLDEGRQASIRASAYREAGSDFVVVLSEARNERIAQVKGRWPGLPAVRLGEIDLVGDELDRATAAASQAALGNRVDLMNARARVVDAWRKIAVQANSLMGVLDVRYHLDSSTPALGSQPFDFDASRTRHQLALNGELPLVRQAERNDYRTALIVFQRFRRTQQAAEDTVLAGVRSELRQLRVLAENYKIQQRAVELSYYQVENSLNVLQAPPKPVPAAAAGASGASSGSDTGSQAALTRQLLDAVRGLLQAQNQLYTVYQNYLVVRMQLYRDLEMMPLDARGVWIDEYANLAPPDRTGPAPGAGGPTDTAAQGVVPPGPLPRFLPPADNP